ncbi:pyridoxamine 5'-phosphate oxidase family protein [Halomarina salina]|uniref:Pyridoxamine 5'-phosphate oxidase family protein n=1 Tax=Halomarina salina TaxID=1872699 RepID=A0ABD5RPV6_9EURY|nr:pyridoxamine 5'-phosphate oxidase family protein [Halomarina salina]
MEHVEYTYTVGMTDEEVTERLRAGTTAVLALAHDNDAYALPVSYAYRDGSLLLRLSDDGHSKKMTYAGTTDEASLLLYDASDGDSWSVVVEGELRRLPPEERQSFDAAAINDAFTDLRVFDEPIGDVEVVLFELVPNRVTGRRTGEHNETVRSEDPGSDEGPSDDDTP